MFLVPSGPISRSAFRFLPVRPLCKRNSSSSVSSSVAVLVAVLWPKGNSSQTKKTTTQSPNQRTTIEELGTQKALSSRYLPGRASLRGGVHGAPDDFARGCTAGPYLSVSRELSVRSARPWASGYPSPGKPRSRGVPFGTQLANENPTLGAWPVHTLGGGGAERTCGPMTSASSHLWGTYQMTLFELGQNGGEVF